MKNITFSSILHNLRQNFGLLVSTAAALCLFVSSSKLSIMLVAGVFVLLLAASAIWTIRPARFEHPRLRGISLSVALVMAAMGANTFRIAIRSSKNLAALAGKLGLSPTIVLLGLAAMGCIAGFYAIYVLSSHFVQWGEETLYAHTPKLKKGEALRNLKRNWYLPLSAMAFFCLTMDNTLGHIVGWFVAIGLVLILTCHIPSVWDIYRQQATWNKILSLLGALGICLWSQKSFYAFVSELIGGLSLPGFFSTICLTVSYFGGVCAVFFVFFCLLLFWKKLGEIVNDSKLFHSINPAEWCVCGLLAVGALSFMVYAFSQSQAFYRTDYLSDVIYTSDSPMLVTTNAYMTLTHVENDLRQPLFAVFAAPFIGIPYLIGQLTGAPASIRAMLENGVQVFLLLITNLMLAKMLQLDPMKRICFMLLSFCLYSQILFTLMMEQYIIAYFWLILCAYCIFEGTQASRMALWGAGGSLLTSMAILPFMSNHSPIKNTKAWLTEMIQYGLEFLVFLCLLGRFDVLFNLFPQISRLSRFGGQAVTFMDKLYQYTAFIGDCLVAPSTMVAPSANAPISWQLCMPEDIDLLGVAVLVLAAVSAIWNRDKKTSLFAAGWMGLSVVMLIILGWGTAENGLILYALYFSWALLVLLFQLVEKIETLLKVRFLVPLISVGAGAALLWLNIPAVIDLLHFAITHYPA